MPYTTSGTELEKEFEITAELGGKEYKQVIKIALRNKYKAEEPNIKVRTTNGTIIATTLNETRNYTKENVVVEGIFTGLGKAFTKEISIDGGQTYTAYTAPIIIDKNRTIKIKATKGDLVLENELELTQIDKLAPTTAIASIDTDLISNTELEITANGEDAEATAEYGKSGIDYYNYYVYKNNSLITSGTDKEQETKGKWIASGLEAGENYDIKVEAVDRVGNKKLSEKIQYSKIPVYTWKTYQTEVSRYYEYLTESIGGVSGSVDGYSFSGYFSYGDLNTFNSTNGLFGPSGYNLGGKAGIKTNYNGWRQPGNKGSYTSTMYWLGNRNASGSYFGSCTRARSYLVENYIKPEEQVEIEPYKVTSNDPEDYPDDDIQNGIWYVKQE